MEAIFLSTSATLGVYIYHRIDTRRGGVGIPIIGPIVTGLVHTVLARHTEPKPSMPLTPLASPTPTRKEPMPSLLLDKPRQARPGEAWVTLATNDQYALGALVVAASLKRCKTSKSIHCLITSGVSQGMRETMHNIFDSVSVVEIMDTNDTENLAILKRPDLGITLTKLHCWKQVQYSKCVFLDADTLVIQNCDELFWHEELSAVADVGWPDIFNSGVFVYRPNIQTYQALVKCANQIGSFDGGDQGLLNTFFHDWITKDAQYHLSFIYNCSSHAVYSYVAAYNRFGKNVKIVHFLGPDKPWHHSYTPSNGFRYNSPSYHLESHLNIWWTIFYTDIQPHLNPEFLESEHRLMRVASYSPASPTTEDLRHLRNWEAGFADYTGKDCFKNIQNRIDKNINRN